MIKRSIEALELELATLRQQQAETPRITEVVVGPPESGAVAAPCCLSGCQYSALAAQLAETQRSFALCELHQPEVWEGDGTCVICEGVKLQAQLAETQQARDRLASDLFDEQHQHHWTRDYLKGAEAQLVTLQASLRSLVEYCQEQGEKHREASDRYDRIGESERSGKMGARGDVYLILKERLTALLPPLEARR